MQDVPTNVKPTHFSQSAASEDCCQERKISHLVFYFLEIPLNSPPAQLVGTLSMSFVCYTVGHNVSQKSASYEIFKVLTPANKQIKFDDKPHRTSYQNV